MFKDIWELVQSDPFYKDQTALLVFPDHGRGFDTQWTDHGSDAPHSNETYFLAMGPGDKGSWGNEGVGRRCGRSKYAATIADVLGLNYAAPHPVAKPIVLAR